MPTVSQACAVGNDLLRKPKEQENGQFYPLHKHMGAWGGQPVRQDSTSSGAGRGGFLKEVTPQLKSRGRNLSSLQSLKCDVNIETVVVMCEPRLLGNLGLQT